MGRKIIVNGEVFSTDTEYAKCLNRIPTSTFTLNMLVRKGVIQEYEQDKFSSNLQVLMDKGLLKHNGSRSEYKVTEKGKEVKNNILD